MHRNNINKKRMTLAFTLSAVALFSVQNAVAQEGQFDLSVRAEASYDDNRFLSATNKQSLYIFRLSPTATYRIENEGSQTTFTARGTYSKPDNEAIEPERFTYGGSIESVHQFEYSTFSIGGGYDHESTFETEFEDTGRFLRDATRDRGFASIGYQTSLSERVSLRLSDNFQILDYSTQLFNNYWSNTAGVGVDVALNEKTSLVQDFAHQHYESRNTLTPSFDSFSYLAGISHALSEYTTLTVTGGATYIDDTFRWSAVAELNYDLEDNQFSLRAAREITPSGLGGFRQTETVSAGTSYVYSENVNMGFEASWRRSRGINNLFALNDEFIGINPWISVDVFRDVSLRLAYRLRRQRIGVINNVWGISNSFLISLEV